MADVNLPVILESVVVLDAPQVRVMQIAVAESVVTLDAPQVRIMQIAVGENIVAIDVVSGMTPLRVSGTETPVVLDGPTVGTPYRTTLARALTLPASAVTSYSAFLNGSVNPQVNVATWWFDWGLTDAYGLSTSPQTTAATDFPLTVGATIGDLSSPLSTGAEYHFRLTVQTGAGITTGNDASFVATLPPVVSSASDPLVPYSTLVEVPHFVYPLVINSDGAAVAEQDSLEEIFSCVRAIVDCPMGNCPELPGFGIPDAAFAQAPPTGDDIVAAIQDLEPRATTDVLVGVPDFSGGEWPVAIDVEMEGITNP